MDGLGWDWFGWDFCVGLLYEHRFAVLIKKQRKTAKLEKSTKSAVMPASLMSFFREELSNFKWVFAWFCGVKILARMVWGTFF